MWSTCWSGRAGMGRDAGARVLCLWRSALKLSAAVSFASFPLPTHSWTGQPLSILLSKSHRLVLLLARLPLQEPLRWSG